MKISKRITALGITVIMLFTMGIQAFASKTIDDVMFDLTTLGIMEGDDNGDFQLDKELTRAEFACMVVRFMNMKARADIYDGQQSFSDVPSDYWAFGSIEVLKSLNLIDGTGDGLFSPDLNVSEQQAAKILMSALGYSSYAEMSGSGYDGYMRQAATAGLLDNLNLSSPQFTRADAARMIYNALDIDIVSVRYSNGMPNYEKISGDTYRNKFKGDSNGTLVKHTGIVTATADAYMNSSRADMDDDQIEIDDILYKCSDKSILQYFGQKVDFYLDEDDDYVIVTIKPNKDNHVSVVDIDNIKSVSESNVIYYSDLDISKTQTSKIAPGAVFLINNRLTSYYDTNTITALKNGSMTLIDNDDDNNIDVISVKSYESVMVDSVNASSSMIYLQDKDSLCGKKNINLDMQENRDKRITLKYADNTFANIEDLEYNDVLSAYVSADETVIELVVERKTASGKLTSIDSDSAVIGGEEYRLENTSSIDNVSINDEVTAYLNFDGKIVYARTDAVSGNYAYILKAYQTEDGESYEVKLLIPDKLTEVKEIVENEDGGENTTQSKLVCRNEKIITAKLSDSITIDGERNSASKVYSRIVGMVVEYKLNSDGELIKITTPEQIGTGKEKYYNSSERTFGKTSGGAFGISLDTQTICIPKDDINPGDDDCLVYIDMNNGQQYDVKGYDKNIDTKTADLIVVTTTMKAGTEGLVTTDSDVAMVQDFSEAINDDDETIYIAELLTQDGNTISYELTDACTESSEFAAPAKGALISYSLDNEYKIDKFKVLGTMSSKLNYGVTNLRKDYETFAGFANDITYDDVSEELNRWVDTLSCTDEEDGENIVRVYEILKKNAPPVFLYNSKARTSEFGSLKDIAIGTDQIFVSAASNKVRAIVVIKN